LQWETVRWLAWWLTVTNGNIKRSSRPRTPADIMRFPWDAPLKEVKASDVRITAEMAARLNSLYEDFKKKKN
jgi:hypothetical protein